MIRALLALAIGAFAVWNIQALDGLEKSLVELFIMGKIPGTEVYLSLTATLAVLAFLCVLLIHWAKQLFDDFLEFSLEYARNEEARRAEATMVKQTLADVSSAAEAIAEEELDPVSA